MLWFVIKITYRLVIFLIDFNNSITYLCYVYGLSNCNIVSWWLILYSNSIISKLDDANLGTTYLRIYFLPRYPSASPILVAARVTEASWLQSFVTTSLLFLDRLRTWNIIIARASADIWIICIITLLISTTGCKLNIKWWSFWQKKGLLIIYCSLVQLYQNNTVKIRRR
jgi:hypothetical protein